MSLSRRLMCHLFAFTLLGIFLSNSIIASQAVEYRKFDPLNNDVWDPYGVGVLESENLRFAPRHFLHCRWGRFLSRNSPLGEADVSFNLGTGLSPSIHDLIVVDQRLVEWDISKTDMLSSQDALLREGPDGLTKREIHSTTYINVDDLYYDMDDLREKKAYYLLKKLEFNKDALDSLPQSVEKIVILIHGWNPDGHPDFYKTGEFRKLSNALKDKLGERSDWSLLEYHWEKDAATGPRLRYSGLESKPDGHHNSQEATEAGHMHGYHLGKLLSSHCSDLNKVHLIAHSAGTWVARSAATYLRAYRDKDLLDIQITLLDPFISGQLAPPETSLTKDRIDDLVELESIILENYFSESRAVDYWFESNKATAQVFDSWSGDDKYRQVRVDHTDRNRLAKALAGLGVDDKVYYDGHSGPIDFYTDSILGTLHEPTAQYELEGKYYGWNDPVIGWRNSLFAEENPEIKKAPVRDYPNAQNAISISEIDDDLFRVPYSRGSEKTGESGGTDVEFVQKMRSELNYGWYEAKNAEARARAEVDPIAGTSGS